MTSFQTRSALADTLVFDGHNDLPWALRQKFDSRVEEIDLSQHQPRLHTDIPRLREGRVGAQFWSVFVPSNMLPADAVVATLEQIDCVHRIISKNPETFSLVDSAAGVRTAVAEGKIASLMGIEGGHSIDESLGVLRMMRRIGVRYMTLTHNDNTPWARSATGEQVDHGLTDFGRRVVGEMNRLGLIVDLSHVAEQTMHDALNTSSAPVIFSHSSCRGVTDHVRNVPDAVLERLPGNNGVLMLTFVPAFISEACADFERHSDELRQRLGLRTGFHAGQEEEDAAAAAEYARWTSQNQAPQATIADIVRHMEHAREVVGPQHLGIGGDFDGIEQLPRGISGVSSYPTVMDALAERGWSTADLRSLAFGNVLRVLEDTEAAANQDLIPLSRQHAEPTHQR
ncbi:dipeptidase [Arthrobacter sp. FW306-2-2C-D06B]|uniref:dipeptidase n=1 Tax=Arthrobacter sp. FW306-2-2C-D06B TaxID=2879618 RepID=UPI001F3EF53E|nr:dipeptidase [Arthrobacter sp. FW306-2-2C-D06B]UKA59434.1 dipeptidase [Arthrobacter sp. FW306-2-2C-D06B]